MGAATVRARPASGHQLQMPDRDELWVILDEGLEVSTDDRVADIYDRT